MKSITRFTKNIRGNECLNCGTRISTEDNFCSKCGQVNDTHRLSVHQYFSEYLSGFFNFDNRFLKTVIPLIFKPGFVTKEYIEGKRIKYVNPFQLYLHITILFFLLIGIFGTIDKFKPEAKNSNDTIPELDTEQGIEVIDSLKSETLRELEKNNVAIDSNTLSLIESGIERATLSKDSLEIRLQKRDSDNEMQLQSFIDSLLIDRDVIDTFKNPITEADKKDTIMFALLIEVDKKAKQLSDDDKDVMVNKWSDLDEGWEEISKKSNLKKKGIHHLDSIFTLKEVDYKIPLVLIRKSGDIESRGRLGRNFYKSKSFMDYQKEHPKVEALTAIDELGYEKSYWNVFLYSKATDWNEAIEDPENFGNQLMDRVFSRISVALFFLLPIFTLVVSLLYIRRKYNYTENLVFVFHVQTVFFLLLLIFLIANRIFPSNAIYFIFTLTFMIYLYKAMKRFYGQGWFKTLVKYFLLNTSFLILALIGGMIISFLAFLI